MRLISIWPAVLGLALAMAFVNIVNPIDHSLAFAAAALTLIALAGWTLEAREVSGLVPVTEPEREAEEEGPGPSYWPLVLAVGIVAIAAGLVYESKYLGLVISLPLAAAATAAWGRAIKDEGTAPAQHPFFVPAASFEEARVGSARGFPAPVAQQLLAAEASAGAAIAIEVPERLAVSRRSLMRITFWAGLGAGLAALATSLADMLYPRGIAGFGGVVSAGTVEQFPPGSKTEITEGKFWLVNLTEAQGGPGFLALWWKCPHLGCTVPWRENFSFVDPGTGRESRGWFRCPCHGSTYTNAGVRVYGPAPRSLDRMELIIDPGSKRISVNTGKITKGTIDNARYAVML